MQIAGISQMQALNFGSKVRIPLNDGTTAVLDVISKPRSYKVTEVTGDIMSHGKSLKKISYKNKKGFSDERFAAIVDIICKNAVDPEGASFKIINNVIAKTKNLDYEA